MEEVTFHTRLDIRRAAPDKMVLIRPYYRKRRYPYQSAGIRVLPEIYDSYMAGRINTRHGPSRAFAAQMEDVMDRAKKAVTTPFSYSKWREHFSGGESEGSSFSNAFRRKRDTIRSEKTREVYLTAERKFLSYDSNIDLKQLTEDDLYRIEHWMEDDGLAWSTIGIYMRCLRAVYNHMRKDGLINHYPFSQYKPPVSENVKKALMPKEIYVLLEYESDDYYDQRAVDFWKICYLMFGKYPSDLKNLKKNQIKGDHIVFTHRAKTSRTRQRKEYHVPIMPALDDLLNTWGNGEGMYVFDFGNFHSWKWRINQRLKKIGVKKGFRIPLTLQTARHSAATKLLHAGASIENIQDLLMHQSRTTSENYLDSFSNDFNREFARKLWE